MFGKQKKVWCCKCSKEIPILYIKCAECDNLEFCLQCFSSGAEVDGHLKSHQYIIIDNGAFPLFDNNWTAEEEHILIDSVEQYGLGNWDEVAFNIPSKTAKEVEDHYMVVYVKGDLGKLTVPADLPNKITDYSPSIHDSTFSTPLPQVSVSKLQQHEIAYMPNRDDYEFEFDNEAEAVVSALTITPDDSELDRGLKLAHVGIYHAKLVERQRRKDVTREYNLVEKFFRKDKSLLHTKFEKETRSKLRCCSQFMKNDQFEKLIKGFVKERQLKRKIAKLKNYRKNGLTKFEGCNAFDAAVYRREKKAAQNNKDSSPTDKPDQASTADNDSRLVDIKGLSEYNLLGNGERKLCVNLKMTPAKYLTAKVLIVKDAILKQHGGQTKCRYSAVVEKSQRRRILNYLKENGWLT